MPEALEFPSADRLRARRGSKWSRLPIDVLPATPAESDVAPCAAVDRALCAWLDRQSYGYPLRGDDGPAETLRRAFGDRMRTAHAWAADPSLTHFVTSGSQALAASVLAFSDIGDGVIFQTPAFPAFRLTIEAAGRRAVPQPMESRQGRSVLAEGAKRLASARVLLLCHPHNPTGRVFGFDELVALADLAVRHDMVVVSNELHAEVMLDARRHQPFAKLFPALAERTVTICSPSKAFGLGGLGCSVLHFGSQELRARFLARIPSHLLGEPAAPSLVASEAAWREGGEWLQSFTELVETNRDRFLQALADKVPHIHVQRSEATYFLWADLRGVTGTGRPFDLLLGKGRVAAADGALFGEGFDGFVRFVIATSPQRIDQIVERLTNAFRT